MSKVKPPPPFQAFMAHLPAQDKDEILEKLKEYDIGSYLIGYETEPYEHTHFLVQMTYSNYHNFSKSLFKDKYHLRGQARGGLPRQYGKLKKIEDIEKMASYTIKSGNIHTNMPQDEVDKYFEKSYLKKEKKKLHQEVFEHLETKKIFDYKLNELGGKQYIEQMPYYEIIRQIKILIINYLRINTEVNMCRSNINSYTQYYLKHTTSFDETEKNNLIYSLLF